MWGSVYSIRSDVVSVAAACLLCCSPANALINNVSNYGWLDQYSLDGPPHHFIGNEACVPTSSTNALTYLQNTSPSIFGTTLSGSTYANWESTDNNLIALMGTTLGSGTYFDQFVFALDAYVTQTKGYSEVQFSGQFPNDTWDPSGGYPKPSYITSARPTVQFITNAIASGSAVLTSIEYTNGSGGHEILVNGITWDLSTQTGILYFVDPLDPSQDYTSTDPSIPLGPVKQTSGVITLSGDDLILDYEQYKNRLKPFTGVYQNARASLFGVLSMGGAAFTPFSILLPTGNPHAIAEAFDLLDPTTSSMFPILAVLNTQSESALTSTFNQLDPSIFNAVLFAEENAALLVQSILRDNLLQYRQPSACTDLGFGPYSPSYTLWVTPFGEEIEQRAHANADPGSSYHNRIKGLALGLNSLLPNHCMLGGGFAYIYSNPHIKNVDASASINCYEGYLYGGYFFSPLWLDIGIGYSYNHVKAKRHVFSSSTISLIAPIDVEIEHKNSSNTYIAHLGLSYDVVNTSFCHTELQLWPYLDVDYFYLEQPSFNESGGGVLDLSVHKKNTSLLRPEIGFGLSLYFKTDSEHTPFIHTTFGYAYEDRFGGEKTKSFFSVAPPSEFVVSGCLPKNSLFCPTILFGVASPSNQLRVDISYHGAFGTRYTANELSVEFDFLF